MKPVDNDKLNSPIIPIVLPPQKVEILEEAPPLAESPVTSSIRPVILWYIVEKNTELNLSETTIKKGDISYTFKGTKIGLNGTNNQDKVTVIDANILRDKFKVSDDKKLMHQPSNPFFQVQGDKFNNVQHAALAFGLYCYDVEKTDDSVGDKYAIIYKENEKYLFMLSGNKINETYKQYLIKQNKYANYVKYTNTTIMIGSDYRFGSFSLADLDNRVKETIEVYTYINKNYNNVNLHMIKTHADNIGFKALNFKGNLDSSGEFGMNGGFFNPPSQGGGTLNIAVKNGVPVISKEGNGGMGNYMSGENGAGTIVYTGSTMKCMIVHEEWDIYNYIKSYVWAQGGISMSLGNSNWEDISRKEKYGSYLGRKDNYSAMIADSDCNIYLIVTDSKIIPGEFREAIQQYFNIKDGTSTNIIGIFLDGSTCAQLKCKEKNITYSRKLSTIITLENKE